MTIRPVDLNGMMQRTQDVTTIKQNEDNKPVFDQQVIHTKIEKDTMHDAQKVKHGEDAQDHKKNYDAKEKGSNEYEGQKKQKKKDKHAGGAVTKKTVYNGFDMKI